MEAACPSPIACYCGSVVDGVVPSLKYWGDAPVTSDPVRRGSSSVSLKRGVAVDVPITVCCLREKSRLSWCQGRAIVGGSAGMNPEVTETLK